MKRLLEILSGGLIAPGRAAAGTPAEGTSFRGEISELYALRALGVTVVILNHTWRTPSDLPELGWILIDSFFLMSGFFITGMLADRRTRPDFFRSFYTRRALRILPLYYVVLGALTAFLVFTHDPDYALMSVRWGSAGWFFAYLGSVPTALSGTWPEAAAWAYVPLWSLQIEEQYYVLFPLLVYFLSGRALARVLVGLACLSPLLRLSIYLLAPDNDLAAYVLLPCRMEALALGGLIALRFRAGPWTLPKGRLSAFAAAWVVIVCAAGIWGGINHREPFNRTVGFTLSALANAYVVLWLVRFRDSRLTAPLRWRPIQHVGRISYGMYILHLPAAFVLSRAGAPRVLDIWSEHGLLRSDGLGWFLAVFALTLALASLSWRYLEGPVLRFRGRVAPRPVPSSLTVAARAAAPASAAEKRDPVSPGEAPSG